LPKLSTIAWNKQIITEDHPYCHDLIYNENILYYTDFDSIFALSSINGNTLWQFKTHRSVNTSFAITKDILYVGIGQLIFAIDKTNGKEIWRYKPTGSPETNPIVENCIIYFGCDDSNLYALNAITGELIWKFDIGNQSGYDPDHIPSSPAITNGVLYVVNDKGFVFAIDLKNGHQIWKLQATKAINSAVTVFDGYLFYTTQESLVKINLKTGREEWKYQSIFSYKNSISVGYGLVFVNRSRNDGVIADNKTIAIDINTGKGVWYFNPSKSNEYNSQSSIIANHILYQHYSDHFLYALDVYTGKVIWKFNTGNSSGNIALGNGLIFVENVQDGYLCALK
jgi:outer membrane protein assembly factor BamB